MAISKQGLTHLQSLFWIWVSQHFDNLKTASMKRHEWLFGTLGEPRKKLLKYFKILKSKLAVILRHCVEIFL
jgi:hypothetical protein